MSTELVRFILHHIDDEWNRLLKEFVQLTPEAFQWQPDPNIHSIAWHVRHVMEWRYALVHVLICGRPNEEQLFCLGWETDPSIKKLVANPGQWFEPRFSMQEDVEFGDRVRVITNSDIAGFPPARYSEVIDFPWGSNRALDEIAEELRHSATHRGQMRELRKSYTRRFAAAKS
jgi:hypothetical protein